MQLTIDSVPHDVAGATVGEVLELAARRAEEAGRLIVEVVVNGTPWDSDALGDEARLAAPAERLDVVTEDRIDVVRRPLLDAIAALDDVERLQRESAEALQADRRIEAYPKLQDAIDVWLDVRQAAVMSATMLEVDLERLRDELPAAAAAFGDLERLLHALLAAIRDQDTVGTTDTLLYEMPDVIDRWRSVLEDLVRRAESGREPAA